LREEEERKRAQKISELFEKGQQAYQEKRYHEALGVFGALLALDPGHQTAQEHYAKIRNQLGEAREKARLAELEAEKKRQEEEAGRREREKQLTELLERGKKAYRGKHYDEALESFEALLLLDPQNRVGQDYYAKIQKAKTQDQQKALEAKRREIGEGKEGRRREKEKQLTELFEKGKKAYSAKQYEEALSFFEQMLLIDPETTLAKEYTEKTRGRIEEARQKALEEEARRAAQLQQKIAEERGRKELEEKQRKEVEEQYEQAKVLFRDGKMDEALRLFESFLIVQPDHPYAAR